MGWNASEATRELIRVLPLLKVIMVAEMREGPDEGATMAQFRVLSQLAEGPLTMSTLARQWRVSLQSMSGLVQSLVERGWLERTPDPRDRRQQILQLSAQGREHYTKVQAHVMDRLTPVLGRLNPDELRAVEEALPALERVMVQENAQLASRPEEAVV